MYTAAADIFGPALVTPEQYYSGFAATSESSGERRLMFAILDDAVHSIQTYGLSKNQAHREEYDAAQTWLAARDADWPFSFENICAVLGLDPDFIRERLNRTQDSGPTRIFERSKPQIVSLESRRRRLALEIGADRDSESDASYDEVPEAAA